MMIGRQQNELQPLVYKLGWFGLHVDAKVGLLKQQQWWEKVIYSSPAN